MNFQTKVIMRLILKSMSEAAQFKHSIKITALLVKIV